MKIPIFTNVIKYFSVFYRYVGNKIFFLCILVFLAGLSDSFGISMILPLLSIGNTGNSVDTYTKFIYRLFKLFGLEVTLLPILFLMVVAFSFKGLFTFVQRYVYANITANLARDLQISMVNKYTQMKYSYYVNSNIGYLNNIITKEIERAVGAFNKYVEVLVFIIYIILYLSVAFAINWIMTAIVIVLSSVLFLLFRSFSATLRKLSLFVSQMNASIQATLIQFIYNFKYLKATQSFEHLNSQLRSKIKKLRDAIFRSEVINAVPFSLIEPLTVLFLSGIIISQVSLMGKPLAGSIILLVFFHRTFTRVFGFQQVWQHFCSFIGGVEVLEQARTQIEANKENRKGKPISVLKNSIVFQNVDFHYGERQVLFDVNLVIPKNKTIGIVGESGVGKTTIFDLIAGLAFPNAGNISIDGNDYRELNIASLRRMIGYVTQDPVVFNDSIANNISFWECNSKDKECLQKIEHSAMLSNCADFIKETPLGYMTIIGDKGVKLSGGQRQRIAIARELFKEPQIMIFDEATSSLDTDSEQYIQNSINKMMGKCTIIIIAHRLSTIKDCDYIYVLSKGRIIEEGRYDELYINEKGLFRKMCLAQQL